MRREENKKRKSKGYLIMLPILFLTIGFAALSSNINILGSTTLQHNTWDIHFESPTKTGGVDPTIAPTVPENSTSTIELNYTVTLNKPGDYYEFTTEVKNGGALRAILDNDIILSGSTILGVQKAVWVNTDGTETVPKKGDIIEKGNSKTLKVRVSYNTDITPEQLNSFTSDVPISYGVELNFVQG